MVLDHENLARVRLSMKALERQAELREVASREREQGAAAVAGQRRCRTAAAECTAGCPRAPRRVTRMPLRQ